MARFVCEFSDMNYLESEQSFLNLSFDQGHLLQYQQVSAFLSNSVSTSGEMCIVL